MKCLKNIKPINGLEKMIRIFKITVNLVSSFFIIYCAQCLFSLIVEEVKCDRILFVVWSTLEYTFPFALIILVLITFINYLIERKLEKRLGDRNYLKPTIIQLVLYFIVIILNAIYLTFACKG